MAADIPLPLFGCLFPDGSGTVFFRDGDVLFLPLFTSLENLLLYKQRIQMDCLPCVLHTVHSFLAFIESPPSRTPIGDSFNIAIDPISPEAGNEFFGFKRDDLIASLKKTIAQDRS